MPVISVTGSRPSSSRSAPGPSSALAPNGLAVSLTSFASVRVRPTPTVTGWRCYVSIRPNLTDYPGTIVRGPMRAGGHMGTLYAYRDKTPSIGAGTLLFDSAEITGDVVMGEDSLIGAGGRSSATPTARSASAPGSRSWRTRCCTCCPTTN